MSDDAKVRDGQVLNSRLAVPHEGFTVFPFDADAPFERWTRVCLIPLLPDGSFPPEVVERVAKAIHKAIVMRDYGRSDWDHVLGTAALAALTETDQ